MEAILRQVKHLTQPFVPNIPSAQHKGVSEKQIQQLRQQHAWIAEPLIRASDYVSTMPFFKWIEQLDDPKAFAEAAKQLYFHSATFPKVLGLMLGCSSMQENAMMPFYAEHVVGEADHHQLLLRWMVEQGIVEDPKDIEQVITSPQTNACINLAYQLAIAQDRDMWLVAINSGIERCSNEFFKALAPKMKALGAGDFYFDVHVEADEHHSIMGLQYLSHDNSKDFRGQQLVAKGLEGISLWAAMLHSWIGIDCMPLFNLDGSPR